MTPLIFLFSRAASADCSFHERDYVELQKTLRAMHRFSEPFVLTARGKRCQSALQSALRNAPLLHASLATDRRRRDPQTCTLLLHGSPDVFTFEPLGDCGPMWLRRPTVVPQREGQLLLAGVDLEHASAWAEPLRDVDETLGAAGRR